MRGRRTEAPDNYYEQTFALPADVSDDVLFITMQPLGLCRHAGEHKSWQPSDGYYRGATLYAYKVKAACLAAGK
jgi:hypothetical protein